MIIKCYRCIKKIRRSIIRPLMSFYIRSLGAEINGKIIINGFPYIRIYSGANIIIDRGVVLSSGIDANVVGGDERLKILVRGILNIGEGTGISNSTIVCMEKISIGKRVFIGGGTKIYDTDFHPIHYLDRIENPNNIKTAPILIDDDVFIGAHTIILKGTKIGKGSVIGAGSVVAKDIPAGQVWAGNPVRYIKDIEQADLASIN